LPICLKNIFPNVDCHAVKVGGVDVWTVIGLKLSYLFETTLTRTHSPPHLSRLCTCFHKKTKGLIRKEMKKSFSYELSEQCVFKFFAKYAVKTTLQKFKTTRLGMNEKPKRLLKVVKMLKERNKGRLVGSSLMMCLLKFIPYH
jgi:hypothetical protein